MGAASSRRRRLRCAAVCVSLAPGQSSPVIQDGRVSCASAIQPTARTLPARVSAFEVQVFAPDGCWWAFEGNGGWLTVVPEEDRPSSWGEGNGTVLVVAAANEGAERTGRATIAGRTVDVTQAGQ